MPIYGFSLARFFLVLTLLVCIAVGSSSLTYIVIIAFSFGVALFNFSLLPVAEFVVLAMLGSVFSMPNKFRIAFMLLLGDVFIQYFFLQQNFEIITQILPIFLAILVFLMLPNKMLVSLSDLVYVKKSEMSSRNLINITRKNIKKRMTELSNVFMDMKQIHLNMTKKELTKEEIVAMFMREINCSCCKDCLDKNRCTRSLGTDNKSNL